ncbi:MAG TPA: aroma-sacti cluster domain-containing protein [Ktedonobacteraceae bacterium]|nr:aroma-sacti cluster domain-containing protein [Ktedonobacteraceae bacterium]
MGQQKIANDPLSALKTAGFTLEQIPGEQVEVLTTLSPGELKILLASKEQIDASTLALQSWPDSGVGYFIY